MRKEKCMWGRRRRCEEREMMEKVMERGGWIECWEEREKEVWGREK